MAWSSSNNSVAPARGSSSDALVAEAERRLQQHQFTGVDATVNRWRTTFVLSDEATLALRMLSPGNLRVAFGKEADLRQKAALVVDANKLIMSLVSSLDPQVEALVTGLSTADGQSATVDPLAKVQQRLQEHASKAKDAIITRWKASFGFGDEVMLALKLLPFEKLQELQAAEADLRQKLSKVPNKDQDELLMNLITALDPEIGDLVKSLQELDGGSRTLSAEDCYAEAERRLQLYKSAASDAVLRRWSSIFGFGDQVMLGLRLLDPGKLKELLAAEADMKQKVKAVSNIDELLMHLISALDPDVEALVHGLSAAQPNAASSADKPATNHRATGMKTPAVKAGLGRSTPAGMKVGRTGASGSSTSFKSTIKDSEKNKAKANASAKLATATKLMKLNKLMKPTS